MVFKSGFYEKLLSIVIKIAKYKAKISNEYLKSIENNEDGKLILVTAINPTPAGEGKTTTTIGLADGLRKIGKNTVGISARSLGNYDIISILEKLGGGGDNYNGAAKFEDIAINSEDNTKYVVYRALYGDNTFEK